MLGRSYFKGFESFRRAGCLRDFPSNLFRLRVLQSSSRGNIVIRASEAVRSFCQELGLELGAIYSSPMRFRRTSEIGVSVLGLWVRDARRAGAG